MKRSDAAESNPMKLFVDAGKKNLQNRLPIEKMRVKGSIRKRSQEGTPVGPSRGLERNSLMVKTTSAKEELDFYGQDR